MVARNLAALALFALAAGCGGPSARVRAIPVSRTRPRPAFALRELAQGAGIRFRPDLHARSPRDILGTAGYGGGFLDYDGDGRLDVLLVGNPRCALFRNDPGGAFREVTREAGLDVSGHWMGCAAADYDNDGRSDLFLSGFGAAALLHNEGGRFRRVPFPFPPDMWGTSAVFFDADRDGRLDLYVGAYVRFGAGTPRLCTVLGIRTACSPDQYAPQKGRLYRNLGDGQFRDITVAAGVAATHGKTLGVTVCDVNADGWADLYLANDQVPGDLFINRGGYFVNRGAESGTALNADGFEQGGMGVDWSDVDGNGRPDLIVTTAQHEFTSLYLNRDGVLFEERGDALGVGSTTQERLGFGARFADLDNDGWEDLLLANGHVRDNVDRIQPGVSYAQPGMLLRHTGRGFAEVLDGTCADVRRAIVGRAVACGDFDNDGRMDALFTNLEGAPLLLHNEGGATHHWLRLRLRGVRSPRDGTGAVVTLEAGGRRQTRWVGTGGSYLACSDPRVHFGLGSETRVDRVIVRWPAGHRQTLECPAADREWEIVETVR